MPDLGDLSHSRWYFRGQIVMRLNPGPCYIGNIMLYHFSSILIPPPFQRARKELSPRAHKTIQEVQVLHTSDLRLLDNARAQRSQAILLGHCRTQWASRCVQAILKEACCGEDWTQVFCLSREILACTLEESFFLYYLFSFLLISRNSSMHSRRIFLLLSFLLLSFLFLLLSFLILCFFFSLYPWSWNFKKSQVLLHHRAFPNVIWKYLELLISESIASSSSQLRYTFL